MYPLNSKQGVLGQFHNYQTGKNNMQAAWAISVLLKAYNVDYYVKSGEMIGKTINLNRTVILHENFQLDCDTL